MTTRLTVVPHPMDQQFASPDEELERRGRSPGEWVWSGTWKHRQFGQEMQLRNPALPLVPLDLFRAEAEDLYAALGELLAIPAPIPFRLPRWERIKQWWQRKVWNRKHHAELALARKALLDEFIRRGPWAGGAR